MTLSSLISRVEEGSGLASASVRPEPSGDDALKSAVAAYDKQRCAVHGPFEQPMSDRNRETIAPMILAAVEAYNASASNALKDALVWIAALAAMRASDDSKVFAKVGRGALKAISERALSALEDSKAGLADAHKKDRP